jgi:hypothetical protein
MNRSIAVKTYTGDRTLGDVHDAALGDLAQRLGKLIGELTMDDLTAEADRVFAEAVRLSAEEHQGDHAPLALG